MTNWLIFNIHSINLWYSIAGLAILIFSMVLIFDYLRNNQKIYLQFLSPYVWMIVIIASVGSVASTLLYSEVFGFVPCSLCWLQRIALYSFALLSVIAFWLKDSKYFPVYGITLLLFGLVVAAYQYIYQMLPAEILQSGILPCLADGSGDCSKKVIEEFGFVTFPFLSAVLFAFLIILLLHLFRSNSRN